MGERLLCKQEVIGSIPFTSTTLRAYALRVAGHQVKEPTKSTALAKQVCGGAIRCGLFDIVKKIVSGLRTSI